MKKSKREQKILKIKQIYIYIERDRTKNMKECKIPNLGVGGSNPLGYANYLGEKTK
jgi:hypothetical protein